MIREGRYCSQPVDVRKTIDAAEYGNVRQVQNSTTTAYKPRRSIVRMLISHNSTNIHVNNTSRSTELIRIHFIYTILPTRTLKLTIFVILNAPSSSSMIKGERFIIIFDFSQTRELIGFRYDYKLDHSIVYHELLCIKQHELVFRLHI